MFKKHNVINWQIRNFAYNIDFKFIKQGFVIFSIFFWGDFVIFTIPPPDTHRRCQIVGAYRRRMYV